MTYGSKETAHISRPPDHPVPWLVWPKGAAVGRGAIRVEAQLWSEAAREGCRLLGVSEVEGCRLEESP